MSETLACEIAKASCKCEGTTLAKTDFESVCACVEREKLLERHCCKPKRKRILELNSSSLRDTLSWGFMVYGEYPRDIPEV